MLAVPPTWLMWMPAASAKPKREWSVYTTLYLCRDWRDWVRINFMKARVCKGDWERINL